MIHLDANRAVLALRSIVEVANRPK